MGEALETTGAEAVEARAEAEPAPPSQLVRRGKQLADLAPDALVISALVALFWVIHRNFEEVEFGGDAIQKWQFARQWHYANTFQGPWTHHMTRMGVNATAWLVQKLFGSGWQSYCIAPFFMAVLQVPFVYLIARRLAGRWAGVLAVLLIAFMPMVHRSASQLLPDGFAGTYGIIGAYLLFRWFDAPVRTGRLIAIGVCCFVGYLAKETYFFFFPGFVVAIWLHRRKLRDVAVYLGVLLTGFLLETACYALFTPFSSRWAAIHSTHGAGDDWVEVGFWDLFQHFHELHDGSKYLMFFAFAAALWLIALPRPNFSHGRGLALIGLSQILGVTFVVRSVFPIKIFQGFDPRYLDPATPFLGALAGTYLVAVIQAGVEQASWRDWVRSRLAPWSNYAPSGAPWSQAAWASLLIGLIALGTQRAQKAHPPLNGFVRGREIARLANDTYDRNLPLVENGGKAKVLAAVYSVYLDDRKLARAGRLPDFDEVVGKRGRYSVIIKNQKAYGKGTLTKLFDEGCYMEVDNGPARNPHTRDRRASIRIQRPEDLLPASCDALLDTSKGQ